jgi:thiosulfate reductase cytochrome b subunit
MRDPIQRLRLERLLTLAALAGLLLLTGLAAWAKQRLGAG